MKIGNFVGDPKRFCFYCPGCKGMHVFTDSWTFNRDFEKPTVQPSILVTGHVHTDAPGYPYDSRPVNCHSFITDGKIQFLGDCNHELVGQTVELPDLDAEAWWLKNDS